MRRVIIVVAACFACFAWLNLPATKPGVRHVQAPAVPADTSLRDLIPASALVAVEVRGLGQRWAEIRGTHALAGFQDSILSCLEIRPELIPGLAGDRAVMFLVPADSHSGIAPIAVLQPADLDGTEALLSGLEGLSCLRSRGALWIGPAGAERLLERCAWQEAAGLPSILPIEENRSGLPPGGLVRGWMNPGALVEFLSDSRMDTLPTPLRWAAAELRAELTAVRCAEFRRDFVKGELIADGLVTYDSSRLPPEISQIFDPDAAPVILPAGIPSNALAVVSFRPEAQAWMPWFRYLAQSDPRGPLRNLSFWLDEFQARYRRDLNRDLFGALGDHGWLLVTTSGDARSTGVVVVVETRHPGAIAVILPDLTSWMGEQIWLKSLGSIMPRSWHEERRGESAGGVTLLTPFSQVHGPEFQLADGYLMVGAGPDAMQAGRAWIENIQRSQTEGERTSNGFPIHGSVLVQGSRLAELIRSARGNKASESPGCILDAIIGLASDLEALRIDMRYEQNAVRFHGRIAFANRMQLGARPPQADGQKKVHRVERESLSSIALSSSRLALIWGMPAVLMRELAALHPRT